jgi:hypothetical protein
VRAAARSNANGIFMATGLYRARTPEATRELGRRGTRDDPRLDGEIGEPERERAMR